MKYARAWLMDLLSLMLARFPKNEKIVHRARKMFDSFESLRSALDDEVCGRFPLRADDEVIGVYYGPTPEKMAEMLDSAIPPMKEIDT